MLHIVLECQRLEGLQARPGTVGIDGGAGIAQQGFYLISGVYAQTDEGEYPLLRA